MAATDGRIKVGSITLALGLIALGLGILAGNFNYLDTWTVVKLWPLLLIGIGVEYFARKALAAGREVQFSVPSIILVIVLIFVATSANAVYSINPGSLFWEITNKNGLSFEKQWQGEPVAIAPGSRLEVVNSMGVTDITASPDDKLHLHARIKGRGSVMENARTSAEAVKIDVSTGAVTRVRPSTGSGPGWGSAVVDLYLQVPAGLTVNVENSMGSITVRDAGAEKMYLQAAMGSVRVKGMSGSLEVESRMGEVNVSDITGSCDIEADNGRITIENPGDNVKASSRNGRIEMSSDKPLDKRYVLKSDNGEIDLTLPRDSNLVVEGTTRNGSIIGLNMADSAPGTEKIGRLTLGGGQGRADLSTRNGSVDVHVNSPI